MRTLISLFLLIPTIASAQCWTVGCRSFSPIAPAAITLDGHCSGTITSSGNVACTLSSVTAGDLITVEVTNHGDTPVGVTDNTGQTYTQVFYSSDSADGGARAGIYYFQNSGVGSPFTVTFTVSSGDVWLGISAQSWKGAATTGALDTGFSPYNQVSTSGTVANPNCGTAVTPAMAGELVIGYLMPDNNTPTAGTNYTLIDTIPGPTGAFAFPEYWIQTTATATNAPFVNAADDWISGCAAFKP